VTSEISLVSSSSSSSLVVLEGDAGGTWSWLLVVGLTVLLVLVGRVGRTGFGLGGRVCWFGWLLGGRGGWLGGWLLSCRGGRGGRGGRWVIWSVCWLGSLTTVYTT